MIYLPSSEFWECLKARFCFHINQLKDRLQLQLFDAFSNVYGLSALPGLVRVIITGFFQVFGIAFKHM